MFEIIPLRLLKDFNYIHDSNLNNNLLYDHSLTVRTLISNMRRCNLVLFYDNIYELLRELQKYSKFENEFCI